MPVTWDNPMGDVVPMTRADAVACNEAANDAAERVARTGDGVDIALSKVEQNRVWLDAWHAAAVRLGYYQSAPDGGVPQWVKREGDTPEHVAMINRVRDRFKLNEAAADRSGLILIRTSARRFQVVKLSGTTDRGEDSVWVGELAYGPAERADCEKWIAENRPRG